MATVLNVPPSEDFTSFNSLVSEQAIHLSPMVAWAGEQCGDTDGLDGLLSLAAPLVTKASTSVRGKLKQVQTGMGTIQTKISIVDKDLRSEDEQNAAQIATTFPDSMSGVPNIASLPGTSLLGNFTDEDVTLETPDKPTTISQGLIGSVKGRYGVNDETGKLEDKGGSIVWTADKVYKKVTGHSLVEQIFKPLVGDWDRLMYLHDAYDTLGDACYTVTGTLRKASWKIGSEWKGATGTAFDSYMFRWTMGLGGIGDAAKELAKVMKVAYEAVVALVKQAVAKLDDLIEKEIAELAEEGGEMVAGDAAIEIVGLGPEDPVADVGAAIWTGYKMVKIIKIVNRIVTIVKALYDIYKAINTAVEEIPKQFKAAQEALDNMINSPMPTVSSLIDDVEQRGFEFEKDSGWLPSVGVARIGMLPSAT